MLFLVSPVELNVVMSVVEGKGIHETVEPPLPMVPMDEVQTITSQDDLSEDNHLPIAYINYKYPIDERYSVPNESRLLQTIKKSAGIIGANGIVETRRQRNGIAKGQFLAVWLYPK